MTKIITAMMLILVTLAAKAQVEEKNTIFQTDTTLDTQTMSDIQTDTTLDTQTMSDIQTDTTLLMPSTPNYYQTTMPTPFGIGDFWDVHEGLNGQVGMGVMIGLGKNNPFKGASFFSDVSLLYAKPLNKHITVALGGTLAQFKIWDKNEIAGSVYAIGNYKFDNHWSASLYGSYNHVPGGMAWFEPYGTRDMKNFNENCARIGGEVTYKFNEKCAVSLGVSTDIPVGNGKTWQTQHSVNQNDRQAFHK